MTTATFYDDLAPFYHLLFPDWNNSVARQANQLHAIIREYWGDNIVTVLDAACGIGTQTLGLASLGYNLSASDISEAALRRAKVEAETRFLNIQFHLCDMRNVAEAFPQEEFDLVISCDNSLPHLLTDDDLLQALSQFYVCTRKGGGCLISVRDYDKEERSGTQVKPYALSVDASGTRYVIFQVWEFNEGSLYDLALYLIQDEGNNNCATHVMRSRYYAIGTNRLMELMIKAGFRDVQRLDNCFYQPIILGRKP
jgi:SAM-dependent methyltransferase